MTEAAQGNREVPSQMWRTAVRHNVSLESAASDGFWHEMCY